MNRSVAMIMAGAVTTLAVIGGTLAISQSGAFAGGPNIQQNGELAVQVSTVEVSPVPSATAESVVLLPEATASVADTQVADDSSAGISDLEATLRARLDQAYKLMKDRDGMYQARLKEAYDKLKQAEAAANATNASATTNTNVQTSDQPVVVVTAVHLEDDQHDENEPPEVHATEVPEIHSTEQPEIHATEHPGDDD